MTINTVLVFLVDKNNNKILLGKKIRGIGAGHLNGAGGKIEPGETPKEAAVREVEEELGVIIEKKNLVSVGEHIFHFKDRKEPTISTVLFFIHEWQGEPHGSEEIENPQWYTFPNLPYEDMWSDDRLWLPHVFAGFGVEGEFHFAEDGSTVISYTIEGAHLKEHLKKKEEEPEPREPRVIIPQENAPQPDAAVVSEAPAAQDQGETPAQITDPNDPRSKPPEAQEEEIPNLRKL